MSKDVNEDQIEATIRRIEAEQAARAAAEAGRADAGGPPAGQPDVGDAAGIPDDGDPDDGESLIEKTIRRIEAQQAERAASALADDVPEHDEPAVAAPHRATVQPDESLIEATLRRLESERAAREAEEAERTSAPAPFRNVSLGDVALESLASEDAPLDQADLMPARAELRDDPDAAMDPPEIGALQPLPHEPLREDADVTAAVARLERGLSETNAELHALAMRFDALLDRLAADGAGPAPVSLSSRRSAPAVASPNADDDWDDVPPLPRIPVGSPPRPAIFRDPTPQTATARKLVEEPEVEDQRIAAAAAPETADARRGFELLPRNYRITVEDKRRGVDLVPLHRALLGLDGVKDMSLLSYSNGVAIVALEATTEIHPDALGDAVARAMARETKVEVHNEQTMVVKLAE